jgi:hypothetical protein
LLSNVRFITTIFIFLVVFAVLFVPPVFAYSENEAKTAIEAAESEVLTCYDAAFEAEKAGANVSVLLSALDEAGLSLSKAKLAYSEGDFDSAVSFANECQSKLNGFVDQAASLRSDAEQAGYLDFMVNFVGSSVGALCIVVGGFALWTFLKKREEARRRV